MPIVLTCSSCQKGLNVADKLAGKKIKCPGCQAIIDVPAPVVEDELALSIPGREAKGASSHAAPKPATAAKAAASGPDDLELMTGGHGAASQSTETKRCINCDTEMDAEFQFCVHCGYDFKTGNKRGGGKIGNYSSNAWTPARIAKAVLTGVLIIAGFYGIYYTYMGLTKEDKSNSPPPSQPQAETKKEETPKSEEPKPVAKPKTLKEQFVGKWKTAIPNGAGRPDTTLILTVRADGSAEQYLELKEAGKEVRSKMLLAYTLEENVFTQTLLSAEMNGIEDRSKVGSKVQMKVRVEENKMIMQQMSVPGELIFERQ